MLLPTFAFEYAIKEEWANAGVIFAGNRCILSAFLIFTMSTEGREVWQMPLSNLIEDFQTI